MAIDKNKIIEAATKYVQKGQYDKAIKEYTKLLEVDPKDARIQQKLGELYQKKNENNLAADCFLKVAESYSADGFFLKAVAVYKQVLKLNPALVDVNLRLAELHQQLGLMSDAMAQYQLVVNHYDKIGNTRASLDTLRKMVDLDPDNIASRIKLAELYARESMNPEAIAEFQHAAEYLKRNNRVDDYIKVSERLVFLDPGNIELTRELASIYLAKQDTKRALAKLQLCFKADPKDVETLSMLAQAFKDLGQVSKTVSVYKELARIYDDQDKVDEERDIWKKISQLAPDDPDARAHLAPAQQAAPAPVAAPSQPARPAAAAQVAYPAAAAAPAASPAGAKASPEQISKLLTETDVYVKYGLHEKALEHLKKVFAVDPSSVEAHEKAFNLYSATGSNAAALDCLVKAIRLSIAKGDLERARTNLQTLCEKDPTHPEIQGFLEKVGGLAPAEEVAEIEDDAIIVEAAEEVIEVAPEPPQVDLALETAAESVENELVEEPLVEAPADSDDEALVLAAQSLESEADGEELIAEAGEEELIAAPPADEDQVALAAAAEPFEEIIEDPAAEVPFDPTADSPFEAGLATTDSLSEDEIDPHEEATRVAYLPSLLAAQGQTPAATPASAPAWENDLGNEEVTAVLPTLSSATQQAAPIDPALQAAADELTEALAAAPAVEEFASAELGGPPVEDFNAEPVAEQPEPPVEVAIEAPLADFSEPEPELVPPPEEERTRVATLVDPLMPPGGAPEAAEAPAFEEPAPAAEEPEEEPGGDELDEAAFFIEQGVFDEAREIIETVQLAYPKSARARELMALLEAKERGEQAPVPEPEPTAAEIPAPAEAPAPIVAEAAAPAPAPAPTQDLAFDLASELANEDFGALGAESGGPPEDFQYSFQDVFSEFKKGVEKIVRPEDVDTHYDLGIAYKEMGLIDDAIGEFDQALSAAAGKKKEIECLTMLGLCRIEHGEAAAAVEAFTRALKCPALTHDSAKALHFELGSALEKAGDLPRALRHLALVEKSDPRYRDVHSLIARLRAQGIQEPVEAEEVTEPSVSKARPRPHANGGTPRVATPTGGSTRIATPAGGSKARIATPAGGSTRTATPAGGSAASHAVKPAAKVTKPAVEGAQPKKGRNIGYV